MDNDTNDTTPGVLPFAQFAARIALISGAYIASVTTANWMANRMTRKTLEALDESPTNLP